MHIENIHSMVETLTSCAKCELDKGIDHVDTKEMGEVAEIIKELCEAEYYAKISKAMDESEYGEDYDEYGPYEEDRKSYRGQPRSKTSGRYMSRGDGRRSNRGRRGYEDMMDYRMTPEMYYEHSPEYYRDMDREEGKMYYSGGSMGGQSSGGGSRGYSDGVQQGGRDSREGRNGRSRRSYMETKEMHKGNTPEDKEANKKELDKWLSDVTADIKELVGDMSNEEKTVLKAKIQNLHSSI